MSAPFHLDRWESGRMGRSPWQQWWKQPNLSRQRIVYEVTGHPVFEWTQTPFKQRNLIISEGRNLSQTRTLRKELLLWVTQISWIVATLVVATAGPAFCSVSSFVFYRGRYLAENRLPPSLAFRQSRRPFSFLFASLYCGVGEDILEMYPRYNIQILQIEVSLSISDRVLDTWKTFCI